MFNLIIDSVLAGFVAFTANMNGHGPIDVKVRPGIERMECFLNKKRVLNQYIQGSVKSWPGKDGIHGHQYRNRLTKKINTVYATECKFHMEN